MVESGAYLMSAHLLPCQGDMGSSCERRDVVAGEPGVRVQGLEVAAAA